MEFGRDAAARAAAKEQKIAEQRALLDAQLRDKGVDVDESGLPIVGALAAKMRRRNQVQTAAAAQTTGVTSFLPAFEPMTIVASPTARASNPLAGESGGSPLASPNRRFGKALSEITRGVTDEELTRRERSRQELVSALEVQVREREARRLIEKLRVWEEEQRELALMNLQGAGKPRPDVPPELVPYIEAEAPGFLQRPGLDVKAGKGGGSTLRGIGMATPPRSFGATAGGGGGGGGAAITEPDDVPGLFDGDRGSARPRVVVAGGGGDAESRLDRILRSVAPTSAAALASEEGEDRGGFRRGGGAGAGGGGGGAESVQELTSLVKELLAEHKTLKETLTGRGRSASMAADEEEEDRGLSTPGRRRGGGGGGASGTAALRSLSSAPGHRRPREGGAPRSRPSSGVVAGRVIGRGGGGGGGEEDGDRYDDAPTRPARKQQRQEPVAGRRAGPTAARRGMPAASAAVDDYGGGGDDYDYDGGGGGGGERPRILSAPVKRPAFGRHDEGKMTAAQRRAAGEAKLREAAEQRRAELEDFRLAKEAAKEARRREAAEQKHLRSALRQGARLDMQPGSPGLHEMLPPAGPVHYSPAAAAQRYGQDRSGRGRPSPLQYQQQQQQDLWDAPPQQPVAVASRGGAGAGGGYRVAVSPIHDEEGMMMAAPPPYLARGRAAGAAGGGYAGGIHQPMAMRRGMEQDMGGGGFDSDALDLAVAAGPALELDAESRLIFLEEEQTGVGIARGGPVKGSKEKRGGGAPVRGAARGAAGGRAVAPAAAPAPAAAAPTARVKSRLGKLATAGVRGGGGGGGGGGIDALDNFVQGGGGGGGGGGIMSLLNR